MSTVKKGKKGEDIAVEYLVNRGYQIIERNYYTRYGELDIVALKEDWLVFIEVKATWITDYYITEALSKSKLKKISKVIQSWLFENNSIKKPWRFDFIGITIYSSTSREFVHSKFIELPLLNR